MPDSIPDLVSALDGTGYIAGPSLATALFLALKMGQPLLLEGEPGVGKTEAAKSLALALDTKLIRLQCYEGLTAAEAIYEWNYPRQLLGIRLAEARGVALADDHLYGEDYLLTRPLLEAVEHPGPRPAVLLIDEVDRADDEFEAFLFEVLGEASVTIPELGTKRATFPPIAVLTSNRTRDLHDALRRRCLYHWIEYPPIERVAQIVRRRVPLAGAALSDQVARSVQRLRTLGLTKPPGLAEAINWASAATALGLPALTGESVDGTLGAVLKHAEDFETVRQHGVDAIVES